MIISSKDQFNRIMNEQIEERVKNETQRQLSMQVKSITDMIRDEFNNESVVQSRPYHYSNESSQREYTAREETEHNHFEQYLRTGDATNIIQTKSLQGTLTDDNRDSGPDLVSSVLIKELIKTMGEQNIFRKLSKVFKVSGDRTEYFQILDSVGDLGWVGETDDRNSSETPKISRKVIKLFEMYAQPKVSRNLLLNDSSVKITPWLKDEVGDGFARTERKAFLSGDGVTRPLGFLHEDANFERITTKNVNKIEFSDLLDLYNSLSCKYREGACLVMSPEIQGVIYSLRDPNGNSVLQHSFKESFPSTLFGFPIYVCCSDMDAGNESGHLPIIFGNFKKGYLIVDCSLNSFLRDEVTEKQWVKFYMTKRVGTGVMDERALKIMKIK